MTRAWNYFNYYTEIEEYFWTKRGAHLLVSPLDWAIMETWQKAEIPLEVVLRGIDRAFESYARSKRGQAGRPLKSLAYCVDAVLETAAEAREAAAGKGPATRLGRTAETSESFSREQLHAYFARNLTRMEKAGAGGSLPVGLKDALAQAAKQLREMDERLAGSEHSDLEELERRLAVLEDRLSAALTTFASDEVILRIRQEMDRALAPYRRKMTADQLAALERRFLQKRLFEEHGVPRLSLFYMT